VHVGFIELFHPLDNMFNIGLHICKIIIGKLMHDFLLVGFLGFLQDGLKDFTLNIVFQFLARVASEKLKVHSYFEDANF
jgi:hypothetical protein